MGVSAPAIGPGELAPDELELEPDELELELDELELELELDELEPAACVGGRNVPAVGMSGVAVPEKLKYSDALSFDRTDCCVRPL